MKRSDATAAPEKSGLMVFWDKYANRILMGLTFLVVLYLLIQYRTGAERRATAASWDNLAAAREKVAQFRSMEDMMRLPPDQIMREAVSLEQSAVPALDAILDDGGQTKLHAQAWVTRGDLFWTLANLPTLPAAATQPALQPSRTPTEYLTTAEAAYQKAVDATEDTVSALAGRFGLAAVAENRGNWDEAKQQYQAIVNAPAVLPSMKTLAESRLAQVDELRKPLFTSPTTAPATATTVPAAAASATTLPAAAAASPTTAPTTAPAP
ncbi:MAG TPA: hypothetical protein VGN72_18395 [Tepidisphaeraceae bacterium]|nr:hypothetical protein [Tepidisphaeraceae bacterium]